ncbi:MAG: response regulator [Proteobacteria bacterium]|nr:response regulator [Pseudomonadota bacterium]
MSKQRKLNILIVEDEPGDARLMQLALRKGGFAIEMQVAGDGLEALRMLRREGERFRAAPRPDLILLDLKMPGKGGLGFLEELKQDERLRAIPAVIVTTSMLDADVLASYRFGAAGYLVKSADLGEFMAAIEILGKYWFGLVRLPLNSD